MTPKTEAGQALLADYPFLAELSYGRTGEPIILAIEAEAVAAYRAALIAVVEDTRLRRGSELHDVGAVWDAVLDLIRNMEAGEPHE